MGTFTESQTNDHPNGIDSELAKINAAFDRVADVVIARARATGTPVVVCRDGKVISLRMKQNNTFNNRGVSGQALPDGARTTCGVRR